MLQLANPHNYPELRERARALRSNQTPAEKVLWEFLQQRPLGVKFLRQHIIASNIVDFFAYSKSLVVEVDGEYHNSQEQQAADLERQSFLERHGYHILRFTNDEVIYNTKQVFQHIKDYLSSTNK